MFKILLCLSFLVSWTFGQGPPPYYGLPLGAVYYSADGTQGEVYASDPNTLTIVNFFHKAKPGCTTFVAGPAKPAESLNVVATKEAIMLPVKYRKQTRNKRQAAKQPGIVWNAGPALGNFNGQSSSAQPPKSEGIQWHDKASPPPPPAQRGIIVNGVRILSSVTPQTLPLAAGSGIHWGENGEEPDAPVYSRFSGPLPREPSEFIGGINVPDEQEEGKVRFNAQRTGPTTTVGPDVYGNDGVTLRLGLAGPAPPRPIQPEAPKPLAFGGLPPSAVRGGSPAGPAPPGPAAEAVLAGPKDEARSELGGFLILPAGSDRTDLFLPRNESKLAKSINSSLPLPAKEAQKGDSEKIKRPSEELRAELGGVIILPSNSSRSEFYLRNDSKILKNVANAPIVKEPQEQVAAETRAPNNHEWFPVDDPRRRTFPPVAAEEQTKAPIKAASNGTHDWFPVEDPRIPKRPEAPANLIAVNAPLQEVNQEFQQQLLNQQPLFVPVEDRKALFLATPPPVPLVPQDPVAAEINGSPKLPAAGDGLFYVLPEIHGEDLTVVLPSSYDITQFQWFGVYDHCKKQRTATVSIHGVRPPKETEIDGFKGWQHDVGSGKIHILNCNTMLISNFTYTGAGKTDAYLYVGNGDFPRGIIQKARAYIVGTLPDRILQNVHSEDILIRLPQGWKTLDISWISVYNPRDNVSYGHALIPPVVAPPCDE